MPPEKHSLEKLTKWERRGNPSSHWTIALSDQWYLTFLVGLLLFHLVASALLPASEDELYYWAWAQNLSLSYYDHPPMTALWVRLSTLIFGDSLFAIRLPACLAHFVVFYLLGLLSPAKSVLGYLLFTPLSILGGMLLTPDIPLMVMWTVYLVWFTTIESTFSGWSDDPVTRVYHSSPIRWTSWVIGGAILGLGILSKYTMAMAPLCVLLCLAMRYRFRAWVKGYALHLIIALLFSLPILIYNARMGFQPLLFQWDHAGGTAAAPSFVFSFLGSQVLLVGALPFLMLPWILLAYPETKGIPVLRVCFYFFFPPLLFFLYQSTRAYLEANWALVIYAGFWPLASHTLARTSFRYLSSGLLLLSFALPCAVSALLLVHLVKPLGFIPPEKDRVTRLKSQFELTEKAAADMKRLYPGAEVFFPTYQWTAFFLYQGIAAEQLYPLGRPSQFTMQPKDICSLPRGIVLLSDSEPMPEVLKCFPKSRDVATYPLTVRGTVFDHYRLWEFTRP